MGEQQTNRDDQLMRDGACPFDLDAGDKAWIELAREQAAQRDYDARCERIEAAQRDVLLTDEQLDRIEASIEKLERFAEYLVAKVKERTMGELWKDDPVEYRAKRIKEAQRELAPAREHSGRTPQQREADARARARETDRFAKAGLRAAIDAHYEMIQEQAARITVLHDLIEQQQTGARGLARRIDKVEQMYRDVQDQIKESFRLMAFALAKDGEYFTAQLKEFKARVIEAVPSVGEPTEEESGE